MGVLLKLRGDSPIVSSIAAMRVLCYTVVCMSLCVLGLMMSV